MMNKMGELQTTHLNLLLLHNMYKQELTGNLLLYTLRPAGPNFLLVPSHKPEKCQGSDKNINIKGNFPLMVPIIELGMFSNLILSSLHLIQNEMNKKK